MFTSSSASAAALREFLSSFHLVINVSSISQVSLCFIFLVVSGAGAVTPVPIDSFLSGMLPPT
jgi:hypothetical protein